MNRTTPILSVDVALFSLINGILHVGVLKRNADPAKGQKALPGGYVHAEEDNSLLDAAKRVLKTKAGAVVPYLEQLYTFSGANRDPRGWSISVAYCALVTQDSVPTLEMIPVDKILNGQVLLAFDHATVIEAGVQRIRSKSSYSSLPCYMLGNEFTLGELQKAYEDILETKLDKAGFRRKLKEMDFLEIIPGGFKTGPFRPAQLYRVKHLQLFNKEI